MKTISMALAAAALLIASVDLAQASPKPKGDPTVSQARDTLEMIEATSAAVADKADSLVVAGLDPNRDRLGHIGPLEDIKAEINQIGSELRTLDAERSSLQPWQAEALDKITPLMVDAARNTRKAIVDFNSAEDHLWTTTYADSMMKVNKDTESAKHILKDYLSLAKAREQEHRIESELHNSGGF